MSARMAAVVLVVSALLEVAAIAHHPAAGRHGDVLRTVTALARLDGIVHAVVIASVAAQTFALAVWSQQCGLRRLPVLAALVAYALGAVLAVGAGTIDGFVVPEIARQGLGGAEERAMAMQLLAASLSAILACTKIALVATAAAIALWSAPLAARPGSPRAVAAVGALAAAAMVAVVAAPVPLGPHVLVIAVTAQLLWYLGVAGLLMREESGAR